MSVKTIDQSLLPTSDFPSHIKISRFTSSQANEAVLQLFEDPGPQAIGVSHHIDEEGKLDFICLASTAAVHIIQFGLSDIVPSAGAFASLLKASTENRNTVGFQMTRTALHIAQTTTLQVVGIDLSRYFVQGDKEESLLPSQIVSDQVSSSADSWAITRLWRGESEEDFALQAWLAACVGPKVFIVGSSYKACVDTNNLSPAEMKVVGRLISQLDLFEQSKSWETENDFTNGEISQDGNFVLQNSRYQNRVRSNRQTRVLAEDVEGSSYVGEATTVIGKQTTINFIGPSPRGPLQRVRVFGREESSNSEKACNNLIHSVLAGKCQLNGSFFIQLIWLPHHSMQWNANLPLANRSILNSVLADTKLNESQASAVKSMVGDTRAVVIHGPPGTGKTTTIAAAARIWELSGSPAWIVAHSNIAVKRIAETLSRRRVGYRLIVSKEFYVEWHEHLYEDVEERLIRSDQLPYSPGDLTQMMHGCHIILCTLNMLSSPSLRQMHTFNIVPVERLIIDEASQINVFEYIHIFHKFQKSLSKICFFGDPHQLPPFGQDEIPTVQNIFDLPHIMRSRENAFLDTQYRMPTSIGEFISEYVYDKRLKSQHFISSGDCLAFVHSNRTGEEKVGYSTRNLGEVDAIVSLVDMYYKDKNFCVITPYDAQRSAIQNALKKQGLPWETVFNLDNFQGHEASYVLISVVRANAVGFLRSDNRMNVMLTRCRLGMVIVSNKGFLEVPGPGSTTLLGLLLAHWKNHYRRQPWVDWGDVSAGTAVLPGSMLLNQPAQSPMPIIPIAPAMPAVAPPMTSPSPVRIDIITHRRASSPSRIDMITHRRAPSSRPKQATPTATPRKEGHFLVLPWPIQCLIFCLLFVCWMKYYAYY